MPSPEHTKKQIEESRKHGTPKDPYERGKKDRKNSTTIGHGDAKKMPKDDWQDYVDGKMGRKRR